ncbi:hypothetical protein [Neobacillus notoginsengisoli]|uniref:hypothetical protein n=1 Tax=Neobacillus notoginsengisoli TaxID=1578198 RepID=UPI001314A8D5|nr:hypothetical protein [Neobacillus notoginsengisoli]
MTHKSGDLSFLEMFHFFGDWEDETMAIRRLVHVCIPISAPFDVIVSSAQLLERIFYFGGMRVE